MKFQDRVRLSAMMFLQYMMLPVWFITVIPFVNTLPGGERYGAWFGMLLGFGTLASPLVGMLADRYWNAERVLAGCNLVYAVLLAACFYVRDPAVLFWLLLLASISNMPGWSLSASIAMSNTSSAQYPSIRVFGSLGWVASAIFSVIGIRCFGIADFDKSPWIFASGALVGLVGAAVALMQPATPPAGKGNKVGVVDALGLRAMVLFKDRGFATFTILLMLSMIPFQWYMGYNSIYLDESGFRYLTLTQNLGQLGELGFMLIVPLIVRHFGYKWAMVLGVAALALRYGAFYASVATGSHLFDFGGILIHGLIFSLLIIGAQMYVDDNAPKELRNQAQGLIMTMLTSFGAFASVAVFDHLLKANVVEGGKHDWSQPFMVALVMSAAIAVAMAIFIKKGKDTKNANT